MENKDVFLKVKDHSVSGEEFTLLYDEELDMLRTSPIPHQDKMADYYKSDDYISHTNSKRNLFEKAFHIVRKISLKQKLKLINSFNIGSKELLDIGCGTGDFLEIAKFDDWFVKGIEPNKYARAQANIKTGMTVFENKESGNFMSQSFDVITLWHVLEHLPQLENHISLFKDLLKPNGRLVVAVPNYKSFDAKYYKNFWAAYDVPRHLWHFSKKSIEKLFLKEHMTIDKIRPMKFDAYYVSLLSEKYKAGWMNIFSALFVATRSNLKATRSGEFSSLIYVLKNG